MRRISFNHRLFDDFKLQGEDLSVYVVVIFQFPGIVDGTGASARDCGQPAPIERSERNCTSEIFCYFRSSRDPNLTRRRVGLVTSLAKATN